jgi:amino acid transporter
VLIAVAAIIILTWINLRGARESGTVFAVPTYAFVGGVLLVILIGLVRYLGLFGVETLQPMGEIIPPKLSLEGFAYVWLLLRAFAGGCTALTGIEAISNGTQAFKPPEAQNAIKTMVAMGIMAMSLFVGITFLSTRISIIPTEMESVLSQMTRYIAGNNLLYYWVQFFTAMILILAANTAYQGFPQLGSLLAFDNYLPRWMQNRGDRLVYSSGIAVLALIASLIVVFFQADEIAMLPLYALGVMLSFSISQTGMFRLMGRIAHLKPGETLRTKVTEIHYERNAFWKRLLNAVGATVTFVVFVILISTKFHEGAWIIAVIVPILMFMFYSIHRHYERVSKALSTRGLQPEQLSEVADVVIVPIGDVHRGTLLALTYAKLLSKDVRALCVDTSPEMKERLLRRWERFPDITRGITLVTIDYDYRDVISPIVDYIEKVNTREFPDKLITVVVPAFLPTYRIGSFLHNQTANRLRSVLRKYKDIVIIDVPIHIDSKI